VSRIIDSRHHWWDVLAGAIIGISFGIVMVLYVCNNFCTIGSHEGSRTQYAEQSREEATHVLTVLPETPRPRSQLMEETSLGWRETSNNDINIDSEINNRLS
jgi:hypothetical protein